MKHIKLSLNLRNYVKFEKHIFHPLLLNYCLSGGVLIFLFIMNYWDLYWEFGDIAKLTGMYWGNFILMKKKFSYKF